MNDAPKVDVRTLASLSRLRVADANMPRLTEELSDILAFVEQVQAFDVGDVAGVVGLHNVMRDDTDSYEPGTFTESLLDAAPKRTGDFVEVKQVLDHVKKSA